MTDFIVRGPYEITPYKGKQGKHIRGDMAKCTPVLFFIVARNGRGATGTTHISEVEDFLIQTAVARNPDLLNVKGTKKADWSIAGIIRSRGRMSETARLFKRMFKMP